MLDWFKHIEVLALTAGRRRRGSAAGSGFGASHLRRQSIIFSPRDVLVWKKISLSA